VRTPDQLKPKKPSKGSGGAAGDAHADSTKPEYVPDKDGFVSIVFVVEGGLARAVQVKTGIQSDTHIEIVDGISDGAEVVSGSYRAISQTLGNLTPVTVRNEGPKEERAGS
jgi:HlyD family secretion protein